MLTTESRPGLEVEQGTPGMETHEHVPYRQHMSKKLQVMFRYRDYCMFPELFVQ